MNNLAEFGTGNADSTLPEFQPVAKYFAAMDCLIYLREDCSYRAFRLDQLRAVLLHPYEDRPVGVKLKGMRFVTEKLRMILRSLGIDARPLTLVALWEMSLTEDGDTAMAKADADRRKKKFAKPRGFWRRLVLSPNQSCRLLWWHKKRAALPLLFAASFDYSELPKAHMENSGRRRAASEVRESYLSDVPRIDGEAAEQVGQWRHGNPTLSCSRSASIRSARKTSESRSNSLRRSTD